MPSSSLPSTQLIKDIVLAAHGLTRGRETGYWVSIEAVLKSMGVVHGDKVDAAIQQAVDARLLATSGGRNPHNLRLTYQGLMLAEGE